MAQPFAVYADGVDGNMHFGLPILQRSQGTASHLYGASSDFVIHPGTSLDVTAVSAEVIEPEEGDPQIPDLALGYVLAAEEAETIDVSLVLSSAEILHELRST